ncbi:Hint domain-containing protein [Actibacterium sp. D379-3]
MTGTSGSIWWWMGPQPGTGSCDPGGTGGTDPAPDGIVSGTDGNDTIVPGYVDSDGDAVDGNDAILPGEFGDDDIIVAGAGDDTVQAGEGNDEVYGGSGSDDLQGGTGDDIIYGDSDYGSGSAAVRESFNWSELPDTDACGTGTVDDGEDLDGKTLIQDTGSVTVTVTIPDEHVTRLDSDFETEQVNVAGIDGGTETVNDNSSLESYGTCGNGDGTYTVAFSEEVTNVDFRVNDIDANRGQVVIRAYDADGNQIPVTLTAGADIALTDADGVAGAETATGTGNGDPDDFNNSVLVEIDGPVARIEIDHNNVGTGSTAINITDIYYDVGGVDTGAAGNDLIHGGDGDDVIFGEGGDDEIYGGAGNDTIDGGAGNDYIQGSEDADVITGGTGNDTIYGQGGDDLLDGGDGDDTVIGGRDNDLMYGGAGNDTLDGFSGDDEIHGGDGDDNIIGGGGDDTLYGEGGNDTIAGGNNVDYLDGGDGDDIITAGYRDDIIIGGDGSDTVFGEEGNDTIDTSAPISSNPLPDRGYPGLFPADTDPDNDKDYVDGGAGDDVIVTGDDDDVILGGTGNDTIDAGYDDDTVDGGDGDDYIVGGEGSDTIDGGAGNDTIYGGLDPIYPDALNIPDSIDAVPDNGKDVIHGGDGNDTIFGQDDNDTIYGDAGDDTIDGGIDNDLIYGGTGNDTILGGDGDDEIYGGAGNDTIDGGAGNDYIQGSEDADVITGGTGNDTIYGQGGDDLLDGGDGDDTLIGGRDNDLMYGGAGNDTLDGFSGDDEIHGGDGDDNIIGGGGDDTLYGEGGNDTIAGGNNVDYLDGGDGDDIITAGYRDDIIIGGAGADILYGEADRDTFIGGNAGDQVFGGSEGDDWDTLDLTGAAPAGGSLSVTYTGPDSDGNGFDGTVTFFDAGGAATGTMSFENIEEVIPCFTPGTRIATPKGERLVQDLKPGDKVITRDNGIQEIRWIGQKALTGRDLAAARHLKPVLIRAGALGNGLPERDMMVSPNHRMLVANDRTALYFEEHEVLVAAKHLVNNRGVHAVDTVSTTYIHFMFDRHEVVLSDGAWTESFQPGDYTLKGMGNAQRTEIFELFPDLKTVEGLRGYGAARRTLRKHEARILAE